MKLVLDTDRAPSDSAGFYLGMAQCMYEVMQSMMALHGDDLEEAMIFLTLCLKTLPASQPRGKPALDSLSKTTELAADSVLGLRLKEIAEATRLNRSTVKRKLDRLIAADLVFCDARTFYKISPNANVRNNGLSVMLDRHWDAYVRVTEAMLGKGLLRIAAA